MYGRIVISGLIFLALAACRERETASWPTGYDIDRDGPVREGPYDKSPGSGGTISRSESPPPDGGTTTGGGGTTGGGTTGGAGPTDPGAAAFVAFGDWGTGGDEQRAVAGAIGRYCATETCQFVLTLGDNFYSDGVEGVTDEQWQEKYTDVYGGLGLPFYASLGNHDNNGNIQAQVDYSAIDPTWHMPATNYSFTAGEIDGRPVVEFFVFNSDYPHFRDTAVQSWMSAAIAASQATWKILVMHHPMYSNGNHGDDNPDSNDILIPIICGKIDLVLSGHDHNFGYLRSSEDGCPIEQLVIGTGGAGLRDVDTEDPRVVSTGKFYGFGWLAVSHEQVAFRMIAVDGSTFYTTTWEKP